MAHKVVPVRVKQPAPLVRKPAKSAQLDQLLQEYQAAIEQYGIIVRYLKAAVQVLPKPECQLLLEFAEIAKKHCARLHSTIKGRLAA